MQCPSNVPAVLLLVILNYSNISWFVAGIPDVSSEHPKVADRSGMSACNYYYNYYYYSTSIYTYKNILQPTTYAFSTLRS
jgi:hypothetical protein